MFEAVCRLGLEGIVSKKLNAPYRSGSLENLDQGQKTEAPAASRTINGTF
jgi:hypothetical protein